MGNIFALTNAVLNRDRQDLFIPLREKTIIYNTNSD